MNQNQIESIKIEDCDTFFSNIFFQDFISIFHLRLQFWVNRNLLEPFNYLAHTHVARGRPALLNFDRLIDVAMPMSTLRNSEHARECRARSAPFSRLNCETAVAMYADDTSILIVLGVVLGTARQSFPLRSFVL